MDKQSSKQNHGAGTGLPPHNTNRVNVNPKTIGVLERDWTTALLLSIFLGLFGIDQFYLGKTGKGILKLFTLGLFGILWIIDVIMIATKSVRGIVWLEENREGNWFKRHKVWTAIIGLFLLMCIIGAVSSNGNQNTVSNTSAASKTQPSKTTSTPAQRQVKGTAVTLGAGTFTVGKDIAVGLYDVTPGAGQSGNFIVTGSDNTSSYNEVLGSPSDGNVSKVRAALVSGDQVQISGLSSVTFTPVTAPFVTSCSAASLYSGTFAVGQDIGAGRYTVTPASGESGNFIVDDSNGNNKVNEVLGSPSDGDVPSVKVTLQDGDIITVSSLDQVNFAPSN